MELNIKDIKRERLEELTAFFIARIALEKRSEATDFFLNDCGMTEEELDAFGLIKHEEEDAWYEFKEEWGNGYSVSRFGELVQLFLGVKIPYYSLFNRASEIKDALNENGTWRCGKYTISRHTGIRPERDFYQEEYTS